MSVALAVVIGACSIGDNSQAAVELPIVPASAETLRSIPQTCPRDPVTLPQRFMLYWTDGPGVDGYYVVVIHPTQLFMRTVHENPNPSKLYFVVPLSAEQYDGLVRFLKAYEGQIFSDDAWSWPGYVVYRVPDARESPFHPDNPSDEEFTRWYEAVEDLARSNLRVVMSELNNALPTDAKLPALPSFLAGTQRPTILD